MASGWQKVRGGSREGENSLESRACTGSDGPRDKDGAWYNAENSHRGSWASKSGKREADGVPDWGGHLIGPGDNAEKNASDKSTGRNADRNGYTDRRGSRWSDSECNRNGSNKSYNRTGHSHRSELNFRRVADGRIAGERDRFGPKGSNRDLRQRRGWEGSRRQGRNWDRAGPSRDSAGLYLRSSNLSRSADQNRSSEAVHSASTAQDQCADIDPVANEFPARNPVHRDDGLRAGGMQLSTGVSNAGNRNVGSETAMEGNRPVFGKSALQAATEDSKDSIVVAKKPLSVDPSVQKTTLDAGMSGFEDCEGADSVLKMEPSRLQDSTCAPIVLSRNSHAEAQVNCTSSMPGGWLYIDRSGVLQGPVRLAELKRQSISHELMLDHLVRRSGTNEWVTLEHARSPSDSRRVLGERAPAGHHLFGLEQQGQTVGSMYVVREDDKRSAVIGDALTSGKLGNQMQMEPSVIAAYAEMDYQIDARVEALMRGFPLTLGKEKETVFAALSTASQRWHHDEMECVIEESPRSHVGYTDYGDQWKDSEFDTEVLGMTTLNADVQAVDDRVTKPSALAEKRIEKAMPPLVPAVKEDKLRTEGVQSCNWPSRGGDWKLVLPTQVETSGSLEKGVPKKLVINGGKSLCEVKTSGLPDPRTLLQGMASVDTLSTRSLELPQWAIKLCEKKRQPGQKHEVMVDDHTGLSHLSSTTGQVPVKSKSQIPPPISQRTTPKRSLPTPLKSSTPIQAVGLKSTKALKTPPGRASSVGLAKVSAPEKPSSVCVTPKGLNMSSGKNGLLQKPTSPSAGGDVGNVVIDHPGKRKFSSGHLDDTRVEKMQKVHLEVEDVRQNRGNTPGSEVVPVKLETTCDQGLDAKVVAPGVVAKELLDVEVGEWFFINGSGTECGPFSYIKLKAMARSGSLPDGSTIYRKSDNAWVSIFQKAPEDSLSVSSHEREKCTSETFLHHLKTPGSYRTAEDVYSPSEQLYPLGYEDRQIKSSDKDPQGKDPEDSTQFHRRYPQFMSYTRGKLHEHAMKAYRAQVFAAVLTEGLDSWLLRKRSETVPGTSTASASPQLLVCPLGVPATSPATSHDSQATRKPQDVLVPLEKLKGSGGESQNYRAFGENGMVYASNQKYSPSVQLGVCEESLDRGLRSAKQVSDHHVQQQSHRRRFIDAGSSDDEDNLQHVVEKDNVHSLGPRKGGTNAAVELDHSKGSHIDCHLLEQPEILLKVFRCLNGNVRDLLAASRTCKTWKLVVEKCKAETTCADLSSLGELCTNKTVCSLVGFGGGKLNEVILRGCSLVTPESVEHLLEQCPTIALVDITGCGLLMNMAKKGCFHVKWVGCNGDISLYRKREGSLVKTKSLKLISEKRTTLSQTSEEHSVHSSEHTSGKSKVLDDSTTSTSIPIHSTPLGPDRDGDLNLESSSDVRKRPKVANGCKVSGGKHSTAKTVMKYENGDETKTYHSLTQEEKKPRSMSKQQSSSSLQRTSEKLISPRKKLDKIFRSSSLNLTDGDRTWEKEIFLMVKKMKDADPKRFFYRAVSDDKSAGGGMDISTIEKKLKEGGYSGSKGWDTIKEDIRLLTRQGFREDKGTPKNLAARAIFKAAAIIQREVEENLVVPHSEQHQKMVMSVKRSGLPENPKGKKRVREDVLKGRAGTTKKVKDDEETESDRSHDRESKRATKLKKTKWSEPEAESSDEDVEEEGLFEDEGEETETDETGSEMASQSEGDLSGDEDNDFSDYDVGPSEGGTRDWGARMTKLGMVPPVTRKYEVIEEYKVVEDIERVKQKMTVELPEDYEHKLQAAQEKRGGEYAHLDIPEVKECQPPRKRLGEEVVEQEVYGIDPYTHNLLLDTMPEDTEDFAELQKQQFIEETLLWTLNKDVSHFTDTGKAPMEYPLDTIVDRILEEARAAKNHRLVDFCAGLLRNMRVRQSKEKAETRDRYVAYRKGLGVVCNKSGGFDKDDFVVEFFGEVYPPWRWYEKQDGIRALQKKEKDQAPEFYNIFLERPKRDAAGYDLLVVDAMHKANFASRLCHSCRPNCEAKVTAVDGQYMIGVYTLRPVNCGEELTFDYNSVTESKEEYNSSVCLCGNQGCRGSYLNLAGANTYQEVMRKCHGLLDRHHLLLEACTRSAVSEADWDEMKQAGLGTCLLSGLPEWAIKYAVHLVKYINMEKVKLPDELMKEKIRKRLQLGNDNMTEQEMLDYRNDAEVQTDGVYNQRLQNLAITLDKVRHVLNKLYKQPHTAAPPLRRLSGDELVKKIWRGSHALVTDLLHFIDPHVERDTYHSLRRRVRDHDPGTSGRVEDNLRRSLLWLRDELRKLPATCRARHDAAADVIHLYAYTEHFFINENYATMESKPIKIDALDIGPRHSCSFGATYWKKLYNREYIWGQLINWFKQTSSPDSNLSKERRGCLMLPDLASCYAKELHHEFKRTYGSRQRLEIVTLMEKKPQKQWPKSLWEFKSSRGIYGSPMLDGVILGRELNREMLQWLRNRPTVFVGPWDEQQ